MKLSSTIKNETLGKYLYKTSNLITMDRIHKGKVCIISGGLGDIGKATADSLARQGSDVAICDVHSEDKAEHWLREIEGHGVNARYDQVDVSHAIEVREWLSSVEEQLGTPSLVIVNAATATLESFASLQTEQWDREIQINLNGAFYMAQYATRRLVEQGLSGRVVFIGSWAGHAVHPHMPAYSVSKAAVRMLCKSMALELAPFNILVNEIAPGYVNAGLSGKIWAENPEIKEHSMERVPIKRVMSAQSVADQIVYLCHPDNNQMTGSTLLMDGGLSLLTS